jgi:bifunctional non-homologous end joining protein LigD
MSESAGRSSRGRADLDEYREKRDFDRTREPAGGSRRRDGGAGALAFVIQKHAASHLHYDLRLEVDGVMRSWAVPKGPSMNPAVKRLAMQVEDHPVEYNHFEGSIPAGEYGGGTVMIWDRGIYRPNSDDEAEDPNRAAARGLRAGKLTFVLEGERLRGGFTLVRTGSDPRPQWLLMKQRDDFASEKGREITARFSTSVESGRSMKAIAAAGERVWHTNRQGGDPVEREGDVPGAPAGVRPARPHPAPRLPADRGWSFEPWRGGERILIFAAPDAARIVDDSGSDISASHASLSDEAASLARRAGRGFVLEGELVEGERPEFHAADLFVEGDRSLLDQPWRTRRRALEALFRRRRRHLMTVQSVSARGATVYDRARRSGWPAVIARRTAARLRPGHESDELLRIEIDPSA